jgi:hypothetical protein
MNVDLEKLILQYRLREISKDDFLRYLPKEIFETPNYLKNVFLSIIENKDDNKLQSALALLWFTGQEQQQIDILNQLLLEDWHTKYEDIIHEVQKQKNPSSIPFIEKAMQNKYEYLISYGTGERQFINQCGHALCSINTDEAINIIYKLSESSDAILRDEMLYRISKINGKNNYERNLELDV